MLDFFILFFALCLLEHIVSEDISLPYMLKVKFCFWAAITPAVVEMTNVMLLKRGLNVKIPLAFLWEPTVNMSDVILNLYPDICFCAILISQFNETVKK